MANPAVNYMVGRSSTGPRTISGTRAKVETSGAFALGAHCFEAMRERMLAVRRPVAPSVEPRALALSALLAADCLADPVRAKAIAVLAAAGTCSPSVVEDTRAAARATLFVVSKLGAGLRMHSEQGAHAEARALRTDRGVRATRQ
jgi:hypothetical protein